MPCPKKPTVNWLDKINFIRHYAVDGCSTTLRVYVETGIQADTNLVMGLTNTSPQDFVRFLLRPKGARTERHGIRKLGTNEAAAEDELIPDTAKLAADTINDVTGWHVPSWGELGDALFDVAKPFFRGAYYLIVANVVEDFAFDWYSGILLSPDSKCTIGRFAYIGGDVLVISQGFRPAMPPVALFPPIGAINSLGGVQIFEGSWCVIITIQLANNEFHTGAGKMFCRMMLGAVTRVQCGNGFEVAIAEGQTFKKTKVVRKVAAPDTISLDYAFEKISGDQAVFELGFEIEAFRI